MDGQPAEHSPEEISNGHRHDHRSWDLRNRTRRTTSLCCCTVPGARRGTATVRDYIHAQRNDGGRHVLFRISAAYYRGISAEITQQHLQRRDAMHLERNSLVATFLRILE